MHKGRPPWSMGFIPCGSKYLHRLFIEKNLKSKIIVFNMKQPCEMEIQHCINEWRRIYGILDMEGEPKFKE